MKAVRVATIMSMLLIVLSGSLPPKVPFTKMDLNILMPAFFFYFVILVLIMNSRKSGLTLAFGTGSMVIYEIAVQYPSHLNLKVGWWPAVYFTLVAVIQTFLVASAFKTYYTMQFETRDLRRLAFGIGIPLVIFSAMNEPNIDGPYKHIAWNEVLVLSHIRKITSCANAYSIERPDSGFPESLALTVRSGGECNNDKLVQDEISGYRITYVPGARDANGAIKTYTISARPIDYYQTGRGSFRSDESGEIRVTNEDRAADGQDRVWLN